MEDIGLSFSIKACTREAAMEDIGLTFSVKACINFASRLSGSPKLKLATFTAIWESSQCLEMPELCCLWFSCGKSAIWKQVAMPLQSRPQCWLLHQLKRHLLSAYSTIRMPTNTYLPGMVAPEARSQACRTKWPSLPSELTQTRRSVSETWYLTTCSGVASNSTKAGSTSLSNLALLPVICELYLLSTSLVVAYPKYACPSSYESFLRPLSPI